MKKLMFACLLLVFFVGSAFSPEGKTFPDLTGKNLDGKNVILPRDSKGKFALVALAYSQKAQEALETWIEPVYTSFADNPTFQARLYIVPMMTGFNQSATGMVESRLKKALDKDYYQYVILYSGSLEPYKSTLGLNDKEKPYLFVVDPRGEIVHSVSGPYSEAKMDVIVDKMSE